MAELRNISKNTKLINVYTKYSNRGCTSIIKLDKFADLNVAAHIYDSIL